MSEKQVTKKTAKKTGLKGVICCNCGSHIAPVYRRVYDDNLKRRIVKKVDETDLYEFIQASKSQTDLSLLEKRFLSLGEIPNADGTLGSNDLSLYPSNIHEVYAMVNNVDSSFNSLPENIQKIFGTKEIYLSSLLDGSYTGKLMQAVSLAQTVTTEQDSKNVTEGE